MLPLCLYLITILLYPGRLLWSKLDRKSTRLNSSHLVISYAVFCLKKKKELAAHHSESQTGCPVTYSFTRSDGRAFLERHGLRRPAVGVLHIICVGAARHSDHLCTI